MTYYTLNAICSSMSSELVKGAKITRITELDYNTMEGQNYQVNVKIITVDGYKDKLVKMLTNDSYLEDWETEEENLKDYLENLFNDLAA